MTRFRRWLLLVPLLVGTQLSTGCYLGLTSRPVLFPNVALSPAVVRPGVGYNTPCGPACYRPFGDGPSVLGGPGYGGGVPVVGGPVYDAAPIAVSGPHGYDVPIYGGSYPVPGCTSCGGGPAVPHGAVQYGPAPVVSGYPIPIAGAPGGPPIAVSPAGGPIHGIPFDSGMVPTVKPPVGSVPLQMPSEVKESKKLVSAGK
jgi:hypothetical protein